MINKNTTDDQIEEFFINLSKFTDTAKQLDTTIKALKEN